MASGLILQGKQKGKSGSNDRLSAPESLWMVTALMKLKDTCFLEGRF